MAPRTKLLTVPAAAGDIEPAIISSITRLLADRAALLTRFKGQLESASQTREAFTAATGLNDSLRTSTPSGIRGHLLAIDLRVTVHGDRIEASIDADGLAAVLDISSDTAASQGDRIPLDVPTIVVQRGKQIRLTILGDTEADAGRRDRKLIELVVRAHDAARRLGLLGDQPVAEISEPEKAKLFRIARFAFLAPDITNSILEGRQPVTLQTRRLLRIAAMPACWSEQRRMLGFR